MVAVVIILTLILVTSSPADEHPTTFDQQTQWVMGTTLHIFLPNDLNDRDEIFSTCFATAHHWDGLLSPWKPEAPMTRLSRLAGTWVPVPPELLDYLERAAHDADRSGHVFDITLTHEGSRHLAIDRDHGRARIPARSHALDPGADGKGVALDAIATNLDALGVTSYFLDFGGSSFLARGHGPTTAGWHVALTGPSGQVLGTIQLVDTALSVSSSVQRRHLEDGTVEERFHLIDLRTGDSVSARRTAAVLSPSATEAEVLSTVAAILGHGVSGRFPACALGVFGDRSDDGQVQIEFARFFTAAKNDEGAN